LLIVSRASSPRFEGVSVSLASCPRFEGDRALDTTKILKNPTLIAECRMPI
jgi:hypothetical protein